MVSDTQKVTVEAAGNLNKVNFSSDVVYQIVVDRFVDGNTSNNPSGSLFSSGCTNLRKYCGGDWQGIINKINDGYLTDMGVTAIWISQPVENVFTVMNDADGSTSYHGYWAIEFKFIKKDGSGNVIWESGSNHVYTTPTSTTGTVNVNWQY